MVETYAVIGANYGDEGKGLVANALCREAFLDKKAVLNVLTNGGPQRGHTAYDERGRRHVYSHFGAGYAYADIYFSKYYMVNPMTFMQEYDELKKIEQADVAAERMKVLNLIYIDPKCMITTPWDMLVNRILENRRSNGRHGSCGYGIWESVRRNKVMPIYWEDFFFKDRLEIFYVLKAVRDVYFASVLKEYGLTLDYQEGRYFYSDILINNFINDIFAMQRLALPRTYESLVGDYERVVFENAQGLLLDDEVDPWGTPTKTDLTYVKSIVGHNDITPYYVTRTYLTKHGNGYFDGECAKADINPLMVDKTNQPNDYQGTLRYGTFNEARAHDLRTRIKDDAAGLDYKVVVTHTNEFECPYLTFGDFYSDNETEIKPMN